MKTYLTRRKADRTLPAGAIYLLRTSRGREVRRAGTDLLGVYYDADGTLPAREIAEVTHWLSEDGQVTPAVQHEPVSEPARMVRLDLFMTVEQVAHLRQVADYRGVAHYLRGLVDADMRRG